MSKKLNIIEAMKMPIGTLFEVILNGEEFGCVAKILESQVQSKKQLVWDNRANSSIVVTDSISRAIFTPIQQPVSFMEAVANADNKIKLDLTGLGYASTTFNTLNRYMPIGKMFQALAENLTNEGIIKVANEGKWYIEESEELEDERLS